MTKLVELDFQRRNARRVVRNLSRIEQPDDDRVSREAAICIILGCLVLSTVVCALVVWL